MCIVDVPLDKMDKMFWIKHSSLLTHNGHQQGPLQQLDAMASFPPLRPDLANKFPYALIN